MQVFKRTLVFFLILCLLPTLAACGSTSQTSPPKSKEYDAVLASGDDYHIVMKRVDTYSGAYDMVGVVDTKGAWLHSLTKNHPLINNGTILTGNAPVVHMMGGGDADASTVESLRIRSIQNNIQYLGEAMFVLNYASNGNGEKLYMLFNAETNEGWDIDACYGITRFQNGYMTCQADNKVYSSVKIVSRDGTITEPGISTDSGNVGSYSDGLFFGGTGFYRIDGTLAIDLSSYKITNTPYFEEGICYLEFENNAGTIYYTEIDSAGNFLYEPKTK